MSSEYIKRLVGHFQMTMLCFFSYKQRVVSDTSETQKTLIQFFSNIQDMFTV